MGLVEQQQLKHDTPSIFSRSFICNWHYLKFISTPPPGILTGPNDRQCCFSRACLSLGPHTEIHNFLTLQPIERQSYSKTYTHKINVTMDLSFFGNTKTHACFHFFPLSFLFLACKQTACVHGYAYYTQGTSEAPASVVQIHTCVHTPIHTWWTVRGPQISGASQTMNEAGNKNMESIRSYICFLWCYVCLYNSPSADSYILLSAPALSKHLQTWSTAIYLPGYPTLLDQTPARHGSTLSKQVSQRVKKKETNI